MDNKKVICKFVFSDDHESIEAFMSRVKKAVEYFGLSVAEIDTAADFGAWAFSAAPLSNKQLGEQYQKQIAKS